MLGQETTSKYRELDIRITCIIMGFYLYYTEFFEKDVLLKPILFLDKNLHF